jgi:excisionase family DNA binding protein
MSPPNRWLTVGEAAEHASVSKATIYEACLRGELQHARVNGRRVIRLKAEWIDAWLEGQAPSGSPRKPKEPHKRCVWLDVDEEEPA